MCRGPLWGLVVVLQDFLRHALRDSSALRTAPCGLSESRIALSGRSVWLNWQWHAIVVGRGRDFLQLTLPCEGGTGKERRSER